MRPCCVVGKMLLKKEAMNEDHWEQNWVYVLEIWLCITLYFFKTTVPKKHHAAMPSIRASDVSDGRAKVRCKFMNLEKKTSWHVEAKNKVIYKCSRAPSKSSRATQESLGL